MNYFLDNFLQTKLFLFNLSNLWKGHALTSILQDPSSSFRLSLFSLPTHLFIPNSCIYLSIFISDFLCLYKVTILNIFFPLASILTVNYSSSLYVKERKHWSTNECYQSDFFLTQGLNSRLLHCMQALCYLSHSWGS